MSLIGLKVKIIKNTKGRHHNFQIGEELIVEKIYSKETNYYRLVRPFNGLGQIVHRDDFQLLDNLTNFDSLYLLSRADYV